MTRNFISILLFTLLHATIVIANGDAIDKKNLSYTTARVKILPLLKLSSKVGKTQEDIIFIHPPKVGGTNIVYIVDAMQNIKSHRFAVPRISGISPGLITEGWIGGLVSLKEQCQNAPNTECDNYKFINGHFPYGAHNYLNKKYKYITLIRHPIEREISSVNFDYQRGYITNKQEAIKTLVEVMIDNPQTRLIAGEKYMSGACNNQILEIAKKNLTTDFLLVGVTEDTNTFIQALISILGNQPVAIGRSQVTQHKIITNLSKNIHSALLHKHKYDLELYKFAKDHWEKWKQTNIVGYQPITNQQKILTIMPDFANTHKATYMTTAQIDQYNSSHSAEELIRIKQEHHGVNASEKKR